MVPAAATSSDAGGDSAFFYGTLMAPSVLARVTGHDVKHLTFRPAILPGHRRHRVQGADYPAVVPSPTSSSSHCLSTSAAATSSITSSSVPASGNQAHSNTAAVRGTWVGGLKATDFWRLDIFEGSEYARCDVKVRLLAKSATGLLENSTGDENLGPSGTSLSKLEEVQTQTYIWIASRDWLDAEEWDFEEFKREKLWRWAGGMVEDEGFGDVEQAVKASEATQNSPPSSAVDPTRGRGVGDGTFEKAIEQQQRQRTES